MTKIDLTNQTGGDWNAKLFEYDNKLYRGFTEHNLGFYKDLLRTKEFLNQINKGRIIESNIIDHKLSGFELVVQHPWIPTLTNPSEWNLEMWREAAKLVIQLELHLNEIDVTIQDAHPWNIQFYRGYKPVFIDLGALLPKSYNKIWKQSPECRKWVSYGQFSETFFSALLMLSWGEQSMVRSIFVDYKAFSSDELKTFVPKPYGRKNLIKFLIESIKNGGRTKLEYDKLFKDKIELDKEYNKIKTDSDNKRFLNNLYNFIDRIDLNPVGLGGSSYISSNNYEDRRNYYAAMHSGNIPTLQPSDNWTKKNWIIYDLLKKYKPESVLDMCSSTGWYSLLAANLGSRVVSFDVDEGCSLELHNMSASEKLDILPLVLNFKSPTPGIGINNEWCMPAQLRLQCDMVFLLAVVHHLVFMQWMTFEQIAISLDRFSLKFAVVEFVLPSDKWVKELIDDRYDWYNIDSFIDALKRYFNKVSVFDSFPETRVILLCEK